MVRHVKPAINSARQQILRLALVLVGWAPLLASANGQRTFEADVRPILKAHCFHCHGEESEKKGGLDVRLARLLVSGGKSGPAIVAGDATASHLVERLVKGEMPPGETKISTGELAIIRDWIDQGARTARPEPASADQLAFTVEERGFWSFQPVVAPPIPKVKGKERARTPVDAFVLQRLEGKGLGFSPDANRRALIRRAYFDLLGLPPSPEEVDAFLADPSADAWPRLIDRLLESEHYGERWARHWLDVAGYADSDGYSEQDRVRESAYKYRDYVIRAFNSDKPFDQFLVEQLAGDELVAYPYRNLSDADKDRITATGFLRNGPDGTADRAVDQAVARNEVMAETIKIVSSSLLGLTVGCARCHSHRFDPITHVDYHRLRAIFEPAYDWKNWRSPTERRISLWSEAEKQRAKEIETKLARAKTDREEQLKQHKSEVLELALAKAPAEAQDRADLIRDAVLNRKTRDRTKEQIALLKRYPKLNIAIGSLAQTQPERYRKELKDYEDLVKKIKASGPVDNYVRALSEDPGTVPATYLFRRGNHTQPAGTISPGELSVLSRHPIPGNDPKLPTTGRRLAYARQLTDGRHPLVARVLVNRVWMHHFGRGIVNTPGDFGTQGERPTHPQLLDWLADQFVKSGWRLKAFHKLLMSSTVYRQASTRTDKLDAVDPDNRLLGRAHLRRLDAETLRDTVLAVSGNLNDTAFGPPLPLAVDGNGRVLIGVARKNDRYRRVNALKGDEPFRRSIYVQARRSLKLGMLEAFDAPTMRPNCEQRNASTVASQSLLFMNNEELLRQSEIFAERVVREAGDEPARQIRHAWRLALTTEPSKAQLNHSLEFLAAQQRFATQRAKELTPEETKKTRFAALPEQQALATFCQFLLSNNAFLYVD